VCVRYEVWDGKRKKLKKVGSVDNLLSRGMGFQLEKVCKCWEGVKK